MSHRRSREDDKRLKKLYEETKNSYGAGAYYDEKKGILRQYSVHSKFIKNQSTRTIRRKLKNSDIIYSKGQYKRLYDYWWELL